MAVWGLLIYSIMGYKEKLMHPIWQKKRLEVLSRDGFTCTLCGDKETCLHVHHEEYIGKNPWDTPNDKLKTVCKHCHQYLSTYSLLISVIRIDGYKIYQTWMGGTILYDYNKDIEVLDFYRLPLNVIDIIGKNLSNYVAFVKDREIEESSF